MEDLDLKELLRVFWDKKIIILIITFAFAFAGVVYSFFFVTPVYESYTTLLLAKNESSDSDKDSTSITQSEITLNQKLVSTYSDLIKSKQIIREVLENLDIDRSEEQIRSNINVSYKDNEIIRLSVKDTDPEIAMEVANELAIVFKQKIAEEIYNLDNVHIIDEAEEETVPSNVNHIKDAAIFTLIGLVVSVVVVLILNMFNTTIKDAKDVERILKVNVLAEIPKLGGKI